jgi:hypothetical protein
LPFLYLHLRIDWNPVKGANAPHWACGATFRESEFTHFHGKLPWYPGDPSLCAPVAESFSYRCVRCGVA